MDDIYKNVAQPFRYLRDYYKMIAIDLSKWQAFDGDRKSVQQIKLTGNLAIERDTAMFFVVEEGKEVILNCSQGILRVLWMSWYYSASGCFTICFCFKITSV